MSSPQGRNVDVAAVLDGHVLERVEAHGKHLFYHWRDAPILHIHLGLIGSFRESAVPPPPPGPNVQLRLAARRATVDLMAATTRELIDAARVSRSSTGSGRIRSPTTPTRTRLGAPVAAGVPIAAALLDQQTSAASATCTCAEALFVAGIHPAPAGRYTLSRAESTACGRRW